MKDIYPRTSLEELCQHLEVWRSYHGLRLEEMASVPGQAAAWKAGENSIICALEYSDSMCELHQLPFKRTPPDRDSRETWNLLAELSRKTGLVAAFSPLHRDDRWEINFLEIDVDEAVARYSHELSAAIPHISEEDLARAEDEHRQILIENTHRQLQARMHELEVSDKTPKEAAGEFLNLLRKEAPDRRTNKGKVGRLWNEGLTDKQIAERLLIAPRTVRRYRKEMGLTDS